MTDFNQRYIDARRAVIARDFQRLNSMQRQAAMTTEGPLLLLAGAGSGKTTVLIQRVYNLLTYGRGSDTSEVPQEATEEDLAFLEQFPDQPTPEEKRRAIRLCAVDVPRPWEIIAITFTNKAAGELKDRLAARLGSAANDIWASTFHSACVRILRRDIDRIGFDKDFTIYDTDDAKRVIRDILKEQNLDEKTFQPRSVLSVISSAKDRYEGPEAFAKKSEHANDWKMTRIAKIYAAYEKKLRSANALDFDDIIYHTVTLLQQEPEVLQYYQDKFRYVLVDEYQDTNHLQYLLTSLLAGGRKNLCVVGDDDQSIYKFRGANVGNILHFEEAFPNARVIRLEQNYRSVQNILTAANEVIKNNRGRMDKTLWTANEEGDLVQLRQFDQGYEEADFIVRDILDHGYPLNTCAVLYRTNAQSRLLEEKCIAWNVPYRLVGGVNFYQRKEIKDVLAYLKTIANGRDDLASLRIVNVPKRGIGAASMGKLTVFASANGYSLYDAMLRVRAVPGMGKAAEKIGRFTDLIEGFRRKVQDPAYSLKQLMEDLLDQTGYRAELEAEEDAQGQTRLENVEELINKAVSYWESAQEPSLNGFLEEVALVADVDELDQEENRLTLMTLHGAKGLEFDNVYISGMEEGLFPSYRSLFSEDPGDLEEERRLCYVGITRAKRHLTLTAARSRMINGETRHSSLSRFISEIPPEFLQERRLTPRLSGASRNPDTAETTDAGSTGGRPAQASRAFTAGSAGFGGGKPAFGKTFTVEKSKTLSYQVGDQVRHVKFGHGVVLEIKDGARDYEVTVCFDTVGVKRMFASFAKLEKEE